jgi:hypothetical protein
MSKLTVFEPRITLNHEFNNDPSNPVTAELLANQDLEEWVHNQREILHHGRTSVGRSTLTKSNDVSIDEHDIDRRSESDIHSRTEMSAALLQPVSNDHLLHTNQSAWSIGLTMSIMREYSLCYVRSNIWPGAFTLGRAKYA